MPRFHITMIVICSIFMICSCLVLPSSTGISLAAISPTAIMLPPPTEAEQVQQPPGTNFCGPASVISLRRVIVRKPYLLEKAKKELMTSGDFTYTADLVSWFNSHGMKAHRVEIRASQAYGQILKAIEAGYYVVATVHPYGNFRESHFFIVYGVDNGNVLVSDSHKHFGSRNRIGIDGNIFQSKWLRDINADYASLILVSRYPTSQK